ncbi:MAG TPA: Uma2 family endonuclease [Phycisphaerae bacterium]|nr:Uma2 family endonuclease [Phycisphaerae bacterium]HRR84147.1 Uma2 family endonuclease [Phycisphaerae bacterium]
MLTLDAKHIRELREDLQHLAPPYQLRKYEATIEDYEEPAHEDLRCEYLDEVQIVHSPASVQHEERLIFLATLLNTVVAGRRLGRMYASNAVMQLGERRFCPDLSYLAAEHTDRIRGTRVVGPTDLVVEMAFTDTREYDLGEKHAACHQGRIPKIWFINADHKQVQVNVLEGEVHLTNTFTNGRFDGRILPGISIEVNWFWTEPLPNPLECLKTATK